MRLAWVLVAAELSGSVPLRPRSREDAPAPQHASVVAARGAGLAPAGPAPGEPAAEAARSRGEGPLTAEEAARRDAAIEALVAAEALAIESPETAEGPLLDALQGFADVAPLVADDARAQEARTFALLALARTRLALGKQADAAAALDEALVIARGRALPVAQFGPGLRTFHDDRADLASSQPRASLAIRCSVPCLVLVDEQPFTDPLPPGSHRVWVEALAPGLPVLRRSTTLAPGRTVELEYVVQAPERAPSPVPDDEPTAPRRFQPRWASVLGLAVGPSAAVVGGVLVGVDHRCPDLSDPRRVPCPRILNTDTGGFTLIGIGSAIAITAAVILAIDEVRARRGRKRQ